MTAAARALHIWREMRVMVSSASDRIDPALMKSLRAGRIVFFAGAGISMDSGLPGAMGLIVPVALHYFPSRSVAIPPPNPDDPLDKWKVELKEREDAPGKDSPLVFGRDILPEELYSILLEHLPERARAACVGMFGCLRPNKRHGYFPKPNFVHRFIALYSYVHDVPVFTVNFDPMFELACEQQGLPYRAYTFRDMDAYEKDCAGGGDRAVRICKVHGSVGLSDDEPFDHRMIKTTAEAISNDDRWADLITGLMGDHDLAFAGYSGRDVDFYPAIRSAALREGKARGPRDRPVTATSPCFGSTASRTKAETRPRRLMLAMHTGSSVIQARCCRRAFWMTPRLSRARTGTCSLRGASSSGKRESSVRKASPLREASSLWKASSS